MSAASPLLRTTVQYAPTDSRFLFQIVEQTSRESLPLRAVRGSSRDAVAVSIKRHTRRQVQPDQRKDRVAAPERHFSYCLLFSVLLATFHERISMRRPAGRAMPSMRRVVGRAWQCVRLFCRSRLFDAGRCITRAAWFHSLDPWSDHDPVQTEGDTLAELALRRLLLAPPAALPLSPRADAAAIPEYRS